MNNPTSKQQQVIDSKDKLTVVVAGPGSGKSTTIVERVKRLVASGVPASQIVMITFTNQAAHVFVEKLGKVDRPAVDVPHCPVAAPVGIKVGYTGTIHGYILRLLMAYGPRTIGLSSNITILDDEEAKAFRESVLKELNMKVSMKEFEAAITNYNPSKQGTSLIDLAVASYLKKITQSGTMDFESILILGQKLVKKLAEAGCVLGTHLFVDEVQDSGDRDFALFRTLPFPYKTIVGDTDQSIYSFRGGRMTHLLAATRSAGCVVSLEENFRSLPVICAAAQRLIEHNTERFAKQTVSARGQDEFYVNGAVNICAMVGTAALEPRFIADRITHYTANGTPPEEIAVLCRTNHLVKEIRLALQAQGIQVAQKKFEQQPLDISDAKLLISLLSNPHNDYLALKWIERKEGAAKVKDVKKFALTAIKSVNDVHLHMDRWTEGVTSISPVLRRYGISETSIAVVDAAVAGLPEQSTLHDLSLALSHDYIEDKEAGEGVRVMTMHGSKGQEFDIVFVAGCEDETIPGRRKNVDVAEERRLMYVAVTRARFQVYLTHCSSRIPQFGPQVPEKRTPSRFLAELLDGGNH